MSDYKLLTFDITEKKIDEWEPLDKDHQSPQDCVINVFHFFDIIDDKQTSKQLSNLKNQVQKGTIEAEMTFFLSNKFKSHDFKMRESESVEDFLKVLNSIPPKTGIISLFSRKTGVGHAVITARNKDGILFILDPQADSHVKVTDISVLENYIGFNKYDSFFTYAVRNKTTVGVKRKMTRSRKETTLQLRKKSVSPQSRKKVKVSPSKKTRSNSVRSLIDVFTKLKL